jgi:hypothetical protein
MFFVRIIRVRQSSHSRRSKYGYDQTEWTFRVKWSMLSLRWLGLVVVKRGKGRRGRSRRCELCSREVSEHSTSQRHVHERVCSGADGTEARATDMLVSLVTWNVDEARALRCASAGKEWDRDFHHEETRRHVRPPAKQLVPGLERAASEWMGRNHPVGCWCVCRRPRKCSAGGRISSPLLVPGLLSFSCSQGNASC